MKIRNIFEKDIERKINPAVVVDQQQKEIVKTEIDEYVFTKDLLNNLYRMLNDILNKKDGKTGIWVNGYYGSGKSHFIKYVHYCLSPETSEHAFKHFITKAKDVSDPLSDASPSNISLLQKKIKSSQVENIMFNIDTVSEDSDDAEKIIRIFLNQFNEFRGYNGKNIPLAIYIEKHLDQIGKFDDFKKKVNELGNKNWDENADYIATLWLDDILDIFEELDPSISIDSVRQKLENSDENSVSIKGDLIPEFEEHLQSMPENYRLVFLVDEISQYIGSNSSLLLNLQSIIEETSVFCGDKIWFATTAQQTIEDVASIGDFGKILGRFETKISLESQKADYITKVRVLGKNSEGIGQLKTFYKANKDAIENQFKFPHDLYHGYKNIDEFNLSYPFIPYQFKLISEVFYSFSNLDYVVKEVRDNERSVLGITHFSARNHKDKDVGYFIPFDAFFNEQFKTNLTHNARRIIDKVNSLDFIKGDHFSQRVVNTLFMVSNLTDTIRGNFPVNVENLATLLMEKPNINRLDLQNKVQVCLDKLEYQGLIRKENEQYHFLKEDEIDVESEIKNEAITMEDRLSVLNDDIIRKFLRIEKKTQFGNNNFNLSIRFDDKVVFNQGDTSITFNFYNNEDVHQKAMGLSNNEMVFCIYDKLNDDETLRIELDRFVKAQKYIKRSSDTASGLRRQTLESFSTRNRNKLKDIQKRFETLFNSTPIISGQIVMDSKDVTGTLQGKYNEAISIHLANIFKKHSWSDGYAVNQQMLKSSAENQQITTDKTLTNAENAVLEWLNATGDTSVDDVVKHFEKPPYGWKYEATIDVLVHLAKKDKKQFEWQNNRIDDLKIFIIKASNANDRRMTTVKSVAIIGDEIIHQALSDYKFIFNENLHETTEANRIHKEITKKLSVKAEDFRSLSTTYYNQKFGVHFRDFVQLLDKLSQRRDPQKLFTELGEVKDEIRTLRDNCVNLQEFVEDHIGKYTTIHSFVNDNKQNFASLGEEHQERAGKLIDYIENADLPGGDFPQMKKAYEELLKAIEQLKKDLIKKAVQSYSIIYREVGEIAKKTGVSDDTATYVSKEKKLNEIESETDIAKIKLASANASSFKTQCIELINKEKGIATETIKMPTKQISNEDEMNEYLESLKAQIQAKLDEGKTIIID